MRAGTTGSTAALAASSPCRLAASRSISAAPPRRRCASPGGNADIYTLWGETQDQVRELTGRVRDAAAAHGRRPRFSLSLRPILADTEAEAWARADRLLATARARIDAGQVGDSTNRRFDGTSIARNPANEGSKHLLAAAAQGARLDKRLWTGMAGLPGAPGNTTALVGTPDQVAEAMLDDYDLGIDTILIRGFDPIADAVAYGRDLLPRARGLVGERAAAARTAGAAPVGDGRPALAAAA